MPICQDINATELAEGDVVFIKGVITNLQQQGNNCVAAVDVSQQGDMVGLEFFAEELQKPTVSTGQAYNLFGDVDRPTLPPPEE